MIGEEWVEIPLTKKAVISRRFGNGVKYRFDNTDMDGIEMTEEIIVDTNVSFRTMYGKATILIVTQGE